MKSSPVIACSAIAAVALVFGAADASAASPQPQTLQAWQAYVAATEARIDQELASDSGLRPTDVATDGQIRPVAAGLIAHWRGAVFLPGATLDALLHALQHPPESGPHQPDVVSLRVLGRQPDHLHLAIRMTRRNIITVTYDTEHVVDYRRHGPARASSRSVSRRIVEIDNAGTGREQPRPQGEDRGFLWRMNSYWRYEQVHGGVIVALESLTLSRNIPFGLGAVVEPMIERIARESVTRTLDHVRTTYAAAHVVRPAATP
jgi:hypothetical protein